MLTKPQDIVAGRLVRAGLPCPSEDCGSSDGCSIYHNKTPMWHCFVCAGKGPMTEELQAELEVQAGEIRVERLPTGLIEPGRTTPLTNKDHPWGFRGISAATCERFGVTVKDMDAGPTIIFPSFDKQGRLTAQKTRDRINAKGRWYTSTDTSHKEKTFFGQQLWPAPSGRNKTLTITFGQFDAMAIYETMGDWPVVSVNDGDQSAKKLFTEQFLYLNQWDTIVLVPDNDESCRKVLPALCQMFMRKIKIVYLTKYKDPNEYVQKGERQLLKDAWFGAVPYTPEKLLTMGEMMKSNLFSNPPEPVAQYPYPSLNDKLGGIYQGDIIGILAHPGVGKTTVTTEIAHHVFENTNLRVGLIYLEETQQDLSFRFATLELNVNLQRKEYRAGVSKEQLMAVAEKYSKDDRVTIVDHGDTCSTEFLESKFEELVLARGCDIIFFDHISMAIADESNKDERIALDRALYAMRALVQGGIRETLPGGEEKVYHPSLILVSHVNAQGKARGSAAVHQVCNVILSITRDLKAESMAERTLTVMTVEKNRRFGDTGPAVYARYEKATGRLRDITEEFSKEEEEVDEPVFDKGSFKYEAGK